MRFRSYILCTSPRSGSTLLCKLLSATGVAGNPGSHFHEPSIDAWLDDYCLSDNSQEPEKTKLRRIFKAAIARGSNDTGVFGLRLQRHSFDFFMEKLAILHPGAQSARERLEAAFGPTLFVHLTRPDKVAQAVSYLKAEQTGLWHRAPDGRELERLAPPAEPEYDGEALGNYVKMLEGYDRQWCDWFELEAIEPMRIRYDDLSADPAGQLASILAALGLDPAKANGVVPGTARLSDETSREWADRFRLEQGL
ncbi:Stf0 family sulfotransferase [Roseibium sp.]|uniref:Stf0 family sulfotransferase n=1 Tax=Roseibium sp. TaxID=1936156 RepID=UPI003A97B6DB